MVKRNKGLTLIELLIAISIIFMVIMGLSSMEIFSRQHVISASRRSLLQNELSLALETMTKSAVQATGDTAKGKPAFQILGTNDGFEIRIDRNNPATPADSDDDLWHIYKLSGNTLTFSCTKVDGSASALCPADTFLSKHINAGVAVNQTMSTSEPASGFYINLSENATVAEVGLAARYDPGRNIALDNPQIQMKARLQTSNVSVK